MNAEIKTIDSLLRNPSFTEFMARSLDSAYYAATGQAQPQFLSDRDATTLVSMPMKDEKVSTSMAGFYALECGLELLSNSTKETFVSWLYKVTSGQAGPDAMLLPNRFANATWKSGQPFRDMERLQRYNFTVATLLSKEEVLKDSIQIVKAAKKLMSLMVKISSGTEEEQMDKLRSLMKDTAVAVALSSFSDSAFAVSQQSGVASKSADTATVQKTVKQMKIASSIAGFYALECGLNYLVTKKQVLPSKMLDSLLNGSLSTADKMLFARFANATWKAGQPFRGLNRIRRDTFTPFYFLNEADIEKDLVQIRAAATILRTKL